MIIPEAKVIFIHVPKTGGTSIEHLLWYKVFKLNEKYGEFYFHKKFFPREHAHDSIGNYNYDNSWFKFGFVRNPYARLISHYAYHQQFWSNNAYSSPYELLEKLRKFKPYKGHPDGFNRHYYRQYSFLYKDMDFIGRYENFHKDLNKAFRKYGLGIHQLNEHIYKTTSEHKKECLEMIYKNLEEITDIYSIDFEKYGYEPYDLNSI